MGFISLSFLAFLGVAVLIYYLLPSKIQWVWLLIVSLLFYLTFDLRYIAFLLLSIATTWGGALAVYRLREKQKSGAAKAILALTLLVNIGLLAFLKFGNYSLSLLGRIAALAGVSLTFEPLSLLMPIGISFYTLQAAGYIIDVYRRREIPEKNPAKFTLFMAFFPQILQGPIPRFGQLAPQLYAPHRFRYETFCSGMQLMLWGYIQKMVIADRAAVLVDYVYGNAEQFYGITLLTASLFYSLQIYADFSGCVDIARGAAEMFGIDLAKNFERPYFATSIQDFWRRWHISLSSWLRDYVYIPLGGNRKGLARKYVNILIVFFVSGLWHGVGLHFLFWGLLHGAYQVAGALWQRIRTAFAARRKKPAQVLSPARLCVRRAWKIFFTFNLVNLAWIFFRVPSLRQGFTIVERIFTHWQPWQLFDGTLYQLGLSRHGFWMVVCGALLMLAVSLLHRKIEIRKTIAQFPLPLRWAVFMGGLLIILLFGVYGLGYNAENFIYQTF